MGFGLLACVCGAVVWVCCADDLLIVGLLRCCREAGAWVGFVCLNRCGYKVGKLLGGCLVML